MQNNHFDPQGPSQPLQYQHQDPQGLHRQDTYSYSSPYETTQAPPGRRLESQSNAYPDYRQSPQGPIRQNSYSDAPPGHQLDPRDLQRQNSLHPEARLGSYSDFQETRRSNSVSPRPDRRQGPPPHGEYYNQSPSQKQNIASPYSDPRDYPPPSQPPPSQQQYYNDEQYDTYNVQDYNPHQSYDSQQSSHYPESNYHQQYPPQDDYYPHQDYQPNQDYPPQQNEYPSQGSYPPRGDEYNDYQQNYPPDDGYYAGQMPPQNYYPQEGYSDPQNYPSPYPMDGPLPNRQYGSEKGGSRGVEEKPSYTPDAIEKYRAKVKNSGDPAEQLDAAKHLIEAAAEAGANEPNPRNGKKAKDDLLQEAIKVIKRLATQGMGFGKPAYPDAQFYLANCYGNGSLGLQIDHDKAFNLYMQASKQNHASATYRTAVCYEVGAGTKRDPHRATQFYRKAAALGDTAAMYKLGMILLNGLLAQHRNIREAVTWLKRAAQNADAENPHALHELGLLHEKKDIQKEVPSFFHDERFALEQFHRAAELGYVPSCFRLGTVYEHGQLGVQPSPQKSIYYYSKAAEKSYMEAELALSGWYLTGSEPILKQSDSEAYLWARKAADKGLSKAEYAIGYYSEVGIGVNQDLEEARRWYLRAAAQGNKRAMQRLTELKKLGTARRVRPERHTRAQTKKEDCVIS